MPHVLLVINTAPDAVELLTFFFEQFEFIVVSTYTHDIRAGRVDLDRLLEQHRPAVVLYDLAPPYGRNWKVFEHLRATTLKHLPLVLTSTNARLAGEALGRTIEVLELAESTQHLQDILAAVRAVIAGKTSGA
jgi:CheY-like chemotaxis protein